MKKFIGVFTWLLMISVSIMAQDFNKYIAYGDSLYELENYEKAAELYQKALNINSESTEALDKLSNCMVSLNKQDSAKVLLYRSLEIDSSFAEGYAGLSNIYFFEEKPDTSLALLKLAQKYNPDTAIYKIFEGINYMYYESLDTALTMFEDALQIEPQNHTAYYYISYVYFSANMLDSALKYVNLAVEQKEEADYFKMRAEIYYSGYRLTDAMFEIDKAIAIEPDNEEYILAKAEIYSSLEQYRDVLRISLPYTRKEYNEDFYYYAVVGYFNLDMIDSAQYYIKKAYEHDPQNDLFYYLEGYISFLKHDYNNALIAFNAAIQLDPTNVEYYYYACNSKLLLNTDTTVINMNEKFFDINQENMSKMKKWSSSKKNKYYHNKLLAKFNFDPTSLGLDEYYMLYFGNALQPNFSGYSNSNPAVNKAFEDGYYERCVDLGKRFIENKPTSVSTYFYIANSYFMLGESELALKYLTIYYGFLQSIISTGDGESAETAFIVSSVTDEYVVMSFHEYAFAGQSLVNEKKHNYDILYYIDGNIKREMYFNIDLFFGK